jgi:hypothetical protein
MSFRILFAAVLGGVVMFIWGAVAHIVLPLGDAGLKALPNQATVLPAIGAQVKDPGLYIFPWPESSPGTPLPVSKESRDKVAEMYKTSPHGLLLFYPPADQMMTTGQLVTEFVTNVVSSLIAAWLVCLGLGSLDSFFKRVFFVALIGLCAGVAVNVPHWNWYGFPSLFTGAEMLEHLVGFTLVGIVIATIIRPPRAPVEETPLDKGTAFRFRD